MDSTHVLTVTIVGDGTTNPSEGIYILDSTSTVEINSYPENNYEFHRWAGDITSDVSNLSILMDRDYDVTCVFKRITFDLDGLIKQPGNIYTNPIYNNILGNDDQSDYVLETSSKKLTLVEYSTCHKIKEIMNYNIQNIDRFLTLNKLYIDSIKYHINNYQPTTDAYDNDIFELAYAFFKKNISNYILQFNEPAKVMSTTFIQNLKTLYGKNEFIKNNQVFLDMLNLDSVDDYYKLITITSNYIDYMKDSLLSGIIEKIISDFSGSEFIIAIALTILEFNFRMFELSSLLTSINSINDYLAINCPHCSENIFKSISYLNKILSKSYVNTENGTLNESNLLTNLDETQLERIGKIKFLILYILNNSWNELKIKTRIEKVFIYNINLTT